MAVYEEGRKDVRMVVKKMKPQQRRFAPKFESESMLKMKMKNRRVVESSSKTMIIEKNH